jgi:hypothetical protein
MNWFNNRRLLEPIGFIPPAEAEERYFAMLNHKAMAAWLKQNGLRQSGSGSGRILDGAVHSLELAVIRYEIRRRLAVRLFPEGNRQYG